MVDFKLSEEQQQYQQLAKDFAQKEIASHTADYDHKGEFPLDVAQAAWELGLMNSLLPEEFGGLGLHVFEACIIAEELAAACPAVALGMEANNLAIAALLSAGSGEQKKRYLNQLSTEFALAGYSGTSPSITATSSGDTWVISGRQNWVINAGRAAWFYLLAAHEGSNKLSAFVLPSETKGISVGQPEARMGLRAADICSVEFSNVSVSTEHLLAGEGEGRKAEQLVLNRFLPLAASASVGAARSAMEHSIRYAKERTTFGTAIANHQAVSFMIADMAKDIEAARLLSWQAAWLFDRDLPNSKEAYIASSFAADMAMKVATDAVQVFGGYGYSREYPVEKAMRDAKVMQALHGTSHRQKIEVARQLAGAARS